MTRQADIDDPRGGVVQNLQGIIRESSLCLDRIRNGIAGLANLIQTYPNAITEKENRTLNEIFSPILDMIEGYSERVQALNDVAEEIDSTPAPIGELYEEERMPAAASTKSTISAYIRRGNLVYQRSDTPKDIPIV